MKIRRIFLFGNSMYAVMDIAYTLLLWIDGTDRNFICILYIFLFYSQLYIKDLFQRAN